MITWEEVVARMGLHVALRSIDAGLIALLIVASLRTPYARTRVSPHVAHALLWVALLHFLVPRAPSFSFSIPVLLPSAGRAALAEMPPIAIADHALWIAVAIYALGVAAVVAVALRQRWSVRRWVRDALPTPADLERRFGVLAAHAGCRRSPNLVVSRSAPAPMALGCVSSTVVVPHAMLLELTSREVDDVLAHELTHLRARDPWWNAARVAAVALWWFHPVVWLLARELRQVREECCDDAVIARFELEPSRYARTLVHAAQTSAGHEPQWLASAVVETRPHPLMTRLQRLRAGANRRARLPLWAWACALVLLSGLWLSQTVDAVHRSVAPGIDAVYLHASGSNGSASSNHGNHANHRHQHAH